MVIDGLEVRAVLARFVRTPQGEPRLLTGGEDNRNVRVTTDIGELVVRQYLLTPAAKDPRVPRVDRVAQLRRVASSTLAVEGADGWRDATAAFLDAHPHDLRELPTPTPGYYIGVTTSGYDRVPMSKPRHISSLVPSPHTT